MKNPPFDDFLPKLSVDILVLRREAAFLYDAVKLYAKSLKELLLKQEDVLDGKKIIKSLLNSSYSRYKSFENLPNHCANIV